MLKFNYLEREVLLFEVRSDDEVLSAFLVREGQLVSPNPRQCTDAVLSLKQKNYQEINQIHTFSG